VISICIIGAHGKKGHGAKFYCPITNLKHHLSAVQYVDNTDLLHIDLSKDKTVNEVHRAIQESVNSLGNLVIAVGGVLQPNKSFYSIILFKWKDGGGHTLITHCVENLELRSPFQEGRRRLLITSELIMQRKPWEL
jgi:hypothetical protein